MQRLFFAACLVLCATFVSAAELSLAPTETGFDVKIDGLLFAGYVKDCKGTPSIWPIIGPTGKKMTRDYPMIERKDDTEKKDHPHHRSLWFTHGDVNGSDFWAFDKKLSQGDKLESNGKIVQTKVIKSECDGKTATIVTENDWIGKEKDVLCHDVRTVRFGVTGSMRYIDFDITVTAAKDGIVFGDTKEGTLGLRVPGTMDVDAKKRNPEWGGKIVNAEGCKDDAAWAKRSSWVDYSGPVEGETLGIAILNHPGSFRYPTYWHVRTYGLYAANPFGEHDFEKKKEKTGELRMDKGDSFTLKYRILFHEGDVEKAGIAEAFKQYSNE